MFQTERIDSNDGGINHVSGSIINLYKKMEKVLKVWQAILGLITIVITVGSIIVNQSNKIETQRLRIEFLESDSRDKGLMIKDLNRAQEQQYKEINSKLTDILVSLQNKENKK
jgi:hypothetical protein